MIGPARASNPDSPITVARQRVPWRYRQHHRGRHNPQLLSWHFWKFYQKYFWAWASGGSPTSLLVTTLERPNVGLQTSLTSTSYSMWVKSYDEKFDLWSSSILTFDWPLTLGKIEVSCLPRARTSGRTSPSSKTSAVITNHFRRLK